MILTIYTTTLTTTISTVNSAGEAFSYVLISTKVNFLSEDILGTRKFKKYKRFTDDSLTKRNIDFPDKLTKLFNKYHPCN